MSRRKSAKEWNYCPTCGQDLDTGWECTNCGLDWLPEAYPRWQRWLNKLEDAAKRLRGKR